MPKPSTKKQRQLIALGRTASGLGKEHWQDVMRGRWGVDSSTRLSFAAADQLITEMIQNGYLQPKKGRRRPTPPQGENVTALASRAELDKIEMLKAVIPWRSSNGFQGWLTRMKIPRVRTAREAYVIIESLKKLMNNEMTKLYGPHWWCQAWLDPMMRDYVREHRPAEYKRAVEAMIYKTREAAAEYKESLTRA